MCPGPFAKDLQAAADVGSTPEIRCTLAVLFSYKQTVSNVAS